MTLLILLVFVPLAEIFILLQVGGAIGALPTIGLVIATAVAGAWLLRQQGIATLARLNEEMSRGVLPAESMLEGAALLVGGVMLLTPGFLTDALGLACLVPVSRRFLLTWLIRKIAARAPTPPSARPGGGSGGGRVIEGEFDVLRDRH